jgi:uncharacterized coiled-coil protein SlyX
VAEQPLEARVAQLENIVATQSEMILKLVEMMNHLGQQSLETSNRLEAIRVTTGEQYQDLGNMLQKLAASFDRRPPAGAN